MCTRNPNTIMILTTRLIKKDFKEIKTRSPFGNKVLGIEVVLLFNDVEDLKGFKIKQLIPRGSLEELKGFNCVVCKRTLQTAVPCVFVLFITFHTVYHTTSHTAKSVILHKSPKKTYKPQRRFKTDNRDMKGPNKFKSEGSTMKRKFDTGRKGKGIQCRECEGYGHIQAECANTLKWNRSMNTTLSDDDKKSDDEDDEEDTDSNETLAFNVIIDLEDTSIDNDHKDDSDDDSVYSDEEVSFE
ncbi:hypothetical protein M9H77_07771 [Catharanthus roseus]|uniref:Uncharacterized protein n=1 Tax=Catharanthus roseus TaxID=4058 RepID=A0ACC0BW06_CATRO|nr:hypothetical protein M9H77_07771 [Catharanthus roseus]